MTGLAIYDTLAEYLPVDKERIKIKWINDVFVDGRKISGVLVNFQQDGGYRLDIGIGVNLNSCPLEGARCLKDVIGHKVDVDVFVSNLCTNVVRRFSQLDEEGFARERSKFMHKTPTLQYQVSQLLEYKGERVQILDCKLETVLHEGEFKTINSYGHALLLNDSNEVVTVMDGRMRKSP